MFYIIYNINMQECWKYVFKNVVIPPKLLRHYVVVKFTNFGIRETWVQIIVFAV